jgi:site-specific recombinase XerC
MPYQRFVDASRGPVVVLSDRFDEKQYFVSIGRSAGEWLRLYLCLEGSAGRQPDTLVVWINGKRVELHRGLSDLIREVEFGSLGISDDSTDTEITDAVTNVVSLYPPD